MHNLGTGSSKAKTTALARTALVLACFAAPWAWASDIVIRSGEGEDTVMQVGPGVGYGEDSGDLRIESDPDNGTLMQVTPRPSYNSGEAYQGPILIVPEIHPGRRK